MKKIVIGFSTTKKIISRIIRWISKSKVSHAWIGFYDETLEMKMVMQAEMTGYEVIPISRWKRKNILKYVFTSDSLPLHDGLLYIAKYLGVEYDFLSALKTGLKRWFKKLFKRPLQSPKKLMCSESVTLALQKAGAKCVYNVNTEMISPGELLKLVEGSKEFRSVKWPENYQ